MIVQTIEGKKIVFTTEPVSEQKQNMLKQIIDGYFEVREISEWEMSALIKAGAETFLSAASIYKDILTKREFFKEKKPSYRRGSYNHFNK